MASGVDTHTHTHTLWRNESDLKKPGVRQPVAGIRLVIKGIYEKKPCNAMVNLNIKLLCFLAFQHEIKSQLEILKSLVI